MLRVFKLFVGVFFLCLSARAQQTLSVTGKVTDPAGQPIPGCSIYFSNTSKGTLASATGEFTLKNLPEGKYELVVSAIGYQTFVLTVSSANYPQNLSVLLKPQSSDLEAVIVEPVDKNGWRRWGRYFIENFIGTTENSWQCKLVNSDALQFRFNKSKNKLTARAIEPLIVENKALGYTIKFQLEEFTSDFNENTVTFLGYPLFISMESEEEKRVNNWIKNRKKSYYGSLLHFMRAVYLDRVAEEGYIIMANVENREVTLHSLDDMIKENADGSKHLYFEDKFQVVYNQIINRISEISEIYLDSPEGIDIQANGSYHSPKVLVANSHWGKYEKLSNMLPFDYIP